MKSEKIRRTINISKDNFDVIKKFCDENTLDMARWVVKNSLIKIDPKMVPKNLMDSLEEKVNTQNLLNHKLLLTSNLFQRLELNKNKKRSIVEMFDLANTHQEADLLHTILLDEDGVFSDILNLKRSKRGYDLEIEDLLKNLEVK